MKRISHFAAIAVAIILSGCGSSDTSSTTSAAGSAPAAVAPSDTVSSFDATKKADFAQSTGGPSIKPYPFNTCAVQIHRPFKNGKPKHRRVYQGYEVLFCCDPCVSAFDMNPEPFMPRIKEAADRKAGN